MRLTRWLKRRIDVLARRDAAEQELEDELRSHLEDEVRYNVERGMDPEPARQKALSDFGGVERTKEEVRDVRGARLLDDVARDVRVGLRSFAKRPAFALAVLLTLGIGIGGNVAMFGVLEASLLRTPPFPEAERLVLGLVTFDKEVGTMVSGRDFLDYRDQARSFAGLDAVTSFELSNTLVGGREPERVRTMLVSPGLFRTLDIDPIAGRTFLEREFEPGGQPVVMLEHGYWTRSFGADPGVVGRAITLDGLPHAIVGVMPPGFRFLRDVDVWRVFRRDDGWARARQFHNFTLVGRLASGVSLAEARSEVDVISRQLADAFPDTNEGKGLHLGPLHETLVEPYRSTLSILVAAVLLVLFVACGNVAGLLLAHGSARRTEMVVRTVMGAGRGRLARQLLTENTLLAVGAGVLGALMARWIERGILGFVSLDLLGPIEPRLSAANLLFALTLSGGTVVLFGLVPALRAARVDPARDLRVGSRAVGSVRVTRLRDSLAVAQVALTVVLLGTTGLLLRSFAELRAVDLGFASERLLTAELRLPADRYAEPESRIGFYTRLREELAALPGVEQVGIVSLLPLRDPGNDVRIARPDQLAALSVFGQTAYQRAALPGYFEAMGIPLLAGRDVAETDDETAPPVIVLSRSTARSLFEDQDPIGRSVGVDVGTDELEPRQVVGVVGDVITSGIASGPEGAMYYPFHQRPLYAMRVAVRARGDAGALTPALREAVRSLAPGVPLAAVATMDDVVAGSLSDRRTFLTVLSLFASMALLLAAVGLYSVLAYRVAARRHEIGVRMALGASLHRIAIGVLRGGLALVGRGLVLGVPAAVLVGQLIRHRLFGIGAADPLTYLCVAAFLVAVATCACLLPARQAARVDPAMAFRDE